MAKKIVTCTIVGPEYLYDVVLDMFSAYSEIVVVNMDTTISYDILQNLESPNTTLCIMYNAHQYSGLLPSEHYTDIYVQLSDYPHSGIVFDILKWFEVWIDKGELTEEGFVEKIVAKFVSNN